MFGAGCFDVFARAAQEEESDEAHVADGACAVGSGGFPGAADQSKWDGFDASGRIIFLLVSAELLGQAVDEFAGGCVAVVLGPHAGHRLAHFTPGVLHCSSADGVTEGGGSSVPPSLAEYLEEGDRIFDLVE